MKPPFVLLILILFLGGIPTSRGSHCFTLRSAYSLQDTVDVSRNDKRPDSSSVIETLIGATPVFSSDSGTLKTDSKMGLDSAQKAALGSKNLNSIAAIGLRLMASV